MGGLTKMETSRKVHQTKLTARQNEEKALRALTLHKL
jgi:hypothetical protein